MTKKATATGAAADSAEPDARTVQYVVNRPYSAGEAPEIVTARVKREHSDPDVLDLVVVTPGHGGEAEVKHVRRSDAREVNTWFEASKPEEPKPEEPK
jgi:hypothetical protein